MSNNTTHTPGPWTVSKHASGLLKIEAKNRVICDGFAKEEANARLIAAAPYLLDALRSAQMAMIGITSHNETVHNALTMINSAIAKATNS